MNFYPNTRYYSVITIILILRIKMIVSSTSQNSMTNSKYDSDASDGGYYYNGIKPEGTPSLPERTKLKFVKAESSSKLHSNDTKHDDCENKSFFDYVNIGTIDNIRKGRNIERSEIQRKEFDILYRRYLKIPFLDEETLNTRIEDKEAREKHALKYFWFVKSLLTQLKEQLGKGFGADVRNMQSLLNSKHERKSAMHRCPIISENDQNGITVRYHWAYPISISFNTPYANVKSQTLHIALIPGTEDPYSAGRKIFYIAKLLPTELLPNQYRLIDAIEFAMNSNLYKLGKPKGEMKERLLDKMKSNFGNISIANRSVYFGEDEWFPIFESFHRYKDPNSVESLQKVAKKLEDSLREAKGQVEEDEKEIKSSSRKRVCSIYPIYASLHGHWIIKKMHLACSLNANTPGLALIRGPSIGIDKNYFYIVRKLVKYLNEDSYELVDRIVVVDTSSDSIKITPDVVSNASVSEAWTKLKYYLKNSILRLPTRYNMEHPYAVTENLGIKIRQLISVEKKSYARYQKSIIINLPTKRRKRFLEKMPLNNKFKLKSGFLGKRYDGRSVEWTAIVYLFLNNPIEGVETAVIESVDRNMRASHHQKRNEMVTKKIVKKMKKISIDNSFKLYTHDVEKRITVIASFSGWELTSRRTARLFTCKFVPRDRSSKEKNIVFALMGGGNNNPHSVATEYYYLASSIEDKTDEFELLDRYLYNHNTHNFFDDFISEREIIKSHVGVKKLTENAGLTTEIFEK